MGFSLSQDVCDLRGLVLLKKGEDLDEWAKKHVFSGDYMKRKSKFKETPFLIDDCKQIFQTSPYDKILRNWVPNFREWLGETYVPSILIDEIRALKTLDPYSYKHVLVISVVGCRMLEIWVPAAATIRRSFQALLGHRLGKTRAMSQLLAKEGELNEAEKRLILEQPVVGYVLNSAYWGGVNHLSAKVALQHQEDRTGKGYPFQVKTNSLLLDILRVLDRFDALISQRPFRYKKFSVREAIDIVKADADSGKIEPDVLKALVDLLRDQRLKDYKKIKFGSIGRKEKETTQDSE